MANLNSQAIAGIRPTQAMLRVLGSGLVFWAVLAEGHPALDTPVKQAAVRNMAEGGEATPAGGGEPVVPELVRGPYLQLSTPNSVVIRWRTQVPSNTRLAYGTNWQNLSLVRFSSSLVADHQVQLTNLTPAAVYYYAIGSTDGFLAGPSQAHHFVTHPLPGSPRPLRVWAIGDAGTADANQIAVRNAFYTWNGGRHIDALLQLGDNAYWTGTDTEYQAGVFNMYASVLQNTVTWPTIGNHDTYSADANGVFPYLDVFTLPTQGEAGGVPSGTERYYSFDLGPAHFVCLDSVSSSRATNDAMALWLQLDLAVNTNRWLIAYWHYPPYSKGSHDSDTEIGMVEMRQNIVPILESGGVDLVLCGHSHGYERSFLLDAHYGPSSSLLPELVRDPGSGRETNGARAYLKPEHLAGAPIAHGGTVYAVVGSSGMLTYGPLNHPAIFVSTLQLGSLVLDITSNRLDAVFLRETGETNDYFTLIKTNFAPVASNLTFTVTADARATLALKAGDPNRNAVTFTGWTRPTNGLLWGPDPVTGLVSYTPARGNTNGDSFSFVASDGRLQGEPGTVTVNFTQPVDSNGNGMADAWEAQYGVSDPNADADGDGVSNLLEYWAGTNPINALSWLSISGIVRGQDGFDVQWATVGGTRYRVLYSNGDLQGSFNGAFTPIARTVEQEMDFGAVGTPGIMRFTDDGSLTGGIPTGGARFYRVQVVR